MVVSTDKWGWAAGPALLVAVTIWASSFISMKSAVTAYHPLVVIFIRMLVAVVLFAFAAKPLLRSARYARGDWVPLVFMALCEPCLYFVFESYALTYTSAAQAGMIPAVLPIMVAVTARFVLNERLSPITWIGFFTAMAGVVWLSLGGESNEHAPNPALGNFLEVVAMVCATGYMVTLKKLSFRYSAWFLTAVQAVVGCVFYLPFFLIFHDFGTFEFKLMPFLSIIYLGSLVSIGAYGLYNFGMSRLPAGQASAFTNLIPVMAVFMGWLILGETFTAQQFMAAGLTFFGVFLSRRRKRPKPEIIVEPAGS